MRSKIKELLINCPRCIEYNSVTTKKKGYLHSIEKINEPFHTLHIDHLGPLECTHKKMQIFVSHC